MSFPKENQINVIILIVILKKNFYFLINFYDYIFY